MRWLRTMMLLAPLSLGGCAAFLGGRTEDQMAAVQRQAAFDLACPVETVQVVELNYRSYGASGCGRHASYMSACGLTGCVALLNGSPALNVAIQEEQRQQAQAAQQHMAH